MADVEDRQVSAEESLLDDNEEVADLIGVDGESESFHSLTESDEDPGIVQEHASEVDEVLEELDEDGETRTPKSAPNEQAFGVDLKQLRKNIQDTLILLGNLKKLQKVRSDCKRSDLIDRLIIDLSGCYGWNLEMCRYFINLLGPQATVAFFEASDAPLPQYIRVNTIKTKLKTLLPQLTMRGIRVDEVEHVSNALLVKESTVAIATTPEYLYGLFFIQSLSSMLPVIALAAQKHDFVLDMCASPGGKTTHIAQFMKNSGIIYANELKKTRTAALISNLSRMGVRNAIVINYDACHLAKVFPKHSLDRILLDAPCSGSGVASKDPSLKLTRTIKDFRDNGQMQKKMILTAIDILKVGGILVYSTCSVSVEENEAIIHYALEERDVKIVEFVPSEIGRPGLTRFRENKFQSSLQHTRRLMPHVDATEGFYVAKLKKMSTLSRKENQKFNFNF